MSGKKVQVCVTVDKGLLSWVDKKIATKDFHNKSHAVEAGLAKLRQMEEMLSGMEIMEDGSVLVKERKNKVKHS